MESDHESLKITHALQFMGVAICLWTHSKVIDCVDMGVSTSTYIVPVAIGTSTRMLVGLY